MITLSVLYTLSIVFQIESDLLQALRTWATWRRKSEPEARPDSFLERFAMAGPGAEQTDKEKKSTLS